MCLVPPYGLVAGPECQRERFNSQTVFQTTPVERLQACHLQRIGQRSLKASTFEKIIFLGEENKVWVVVLTYIKTHSKRNINCGIGSVIAG